MSQAEETASEPQSFWTSQDLADLINDRMGQFDDWKPAPAELALDLLREDVVLHNCNGLPTHDPEPIKWPRHDPDAISELPANAIWFDQIPDTKDGIAEYPRFRAGLFAFADSLALFDRTMRHRFGDDYLAVAATGLKSNARRRRFLELLSEAVAAEPSETADMLEVIGREGLRYPRPGVSEGGYRERDCGIRPLIETAVQVERFATAVASAPTNETPASDGKRRDPNKRPRAIVFIHSKAKVEVRFAGESLSVRGLKAKLLDLLFLIEETVRHQQIWDCLYKNVPFTATGGGERAPPRLRRVKADLQKALLDTFGKVDGESEWILSEKGGYRLNRHVVNWCHPKNFDAKSVLRTLTDDSDQQQS